MYHNNINDRKKTFYPDSSVFYRFDDLTCSVSDNSSYKGKTKYCLVGKRRQTANLMIEIVGMNHKPSYYWLSLYYLYRLKESHRPDIPSAVTSEGYLPVILQYYMIAAYTRHQFILHCSICSIYWCPLHIVCIAVLTMSDLIYSCIHNITNITTYINTSMANVVT